MAEHVQPATLRGRTALRQDSHWIALTLLVIVFTLGNAGRARAQGGADDVLRFTSGTLAGWTMAGDTTTWVIGKNPPLFSNPDDPEQFVVNSYENGEAKTGTLRSPVFTITEKTQEFYLAGWDGVTDSDTNGGQYNYIYLKSPPNGQVLYQTHTPGSTKLVKTRWATDNLIGQKAYIEVVDNNKQFRPSGGYAWIALAGYRQVAGEISAEDLAFTSGTFKGWSVTPATGTWKVILTTSFYMNPGDPVRNVATSLEYGEERLGTLRSDPFTITKPYQTFTIAGADGTTTTTNSGTNNYIRLRSFPDGQILCQTHTPGVSTLEPAIWKTKDLIGRKVYVEVVDNNPRYYSGGFAWIALADYKQTDSVGGAAEFETNLPLVVINTDGGQIVDSPKIPAQMEIHWDPNGGLNSTTSTQINYSGGIGIEIRGTSSQGMPKKQYGLELWDANGLTVKAELLGMPKESDWVLSAAYSDKSLMRNYLAYALSNQMDRYAARTCFVEVILNDRYDGVYTFMEKIKRDPNRVNIQKMDPLMTAAPEITGGYLLELTPLWKAKAGDSVFTSAKGRVFVNDYPNAAAITVAQKNWIKGYIDAFESALYGANWKNPATGYAKYLDVDAFIDYMLIGEVTHNVDIFNSSTFMSKDRDGKLVLGPQWDFDLAMGNCEVNINNVIYGSSRVWTFEAGNEAWYSWAPRLKQDPDFVQRYFARYVQLRKTVFSDANVSKLIDDAAAQLQDAQVRNFKRWPILGVYVWPNVAPYPATYAGEVDRLKGWMIDRLHWLDTNKVYRNAAEDAWDCYE